MASQTPLLALLSVLFFRNKHSLQLQQAPRDTQFFCATMKTYNVQSPLVFVASTEGITYATVNHNHVLGAVRIFILLRHQAVLTNTCLIDVLVRHVLVRHVANVQVLIK